MQWQEITCSGSTFSPNVNTTVTGKTVTTSGSIRVTLPDGVYRGSWSPSSTFYVRNATTISFMRQGSPYVSTSYLATFHLSVLPITYTDCQSDVNIGLAAGSYTFSSSAEGFAVLSSVIEEMDTYIQIRVPFKTPSAMAQAEGKGEVKTSSGGSGTSMYFNTDGKSYEVWGGNRVIGCEATATMTAVPDSDSVKFIGWFLDGVLVSTEESLTIKQKDTEDNSVKTYVYYAKFEEESSSSSSEPESSSSSEPESSSSSEPESSSSDEPESSSSSVGKVMLTASVDPSGAGYVSGDIGEHSYNDTVTLSATPFDCYEFDYWYCEQTAMRLESRTITITLDRDQHWTAYFKKIKYTIEAYPDPWEGGSVSGAGTYNCGDTYTLDVTPDDCYQFVKWVSARGSTSYTNPISARVGRDETWTAILEKLSFTVTVLADGIGYGSVYGGGKVECGEIVTIGAVANPGYAFDYWQSSSGETVTEQEYTYTPDQDETWTAIFKVSESSSDSSRYESSASEPSTSEPSASEHSSSEPPGPESSSYSGPYYRVTTAYFGNGSTSGDGTYREGQACTIVAYPAAGWEFVKWQSDTGHEAVTEQYTFFVHADVTWVAQFREKGGESSQASSSTQSSSSSSSTPPIYRVTTSHTYGGGTTSGDGLYFEGTWCTIVATPADNYEFVRWQSDTGQEAVTPEYHFIVHEDVHWAALFRWKEAPSESDTDAYVEVVSQGGGRVSGGGECSIGDMVTVTATPNPGCTFVSWYCFMGGESWVSTDNVLTFAVAAPYARCDAYFDCPETSSSVTSLSSSSSPQDSSSVSSVSFSSSSVAKYPVNVFTVGGGMVTGGGMYAPGSTCTIKAIPNAGCTFFYWEITTDSGTSTSRDATLSFVVESPVTCEAFFNCPEPSSSSHSPGPGPGPGPESSSVSQTSSSSYQPPESSSTGSVSSSTSPSGSEYSFSFSSFSSSSSCEVTVETSGSPERAAKWTKGDGTYPCSSSSIEISEKRRCSPWTFVHWKITRNDECFLVTSSTVNLADFLGSRDGGVTFSCVACYSHGNSKSLFYPEKYPSKMLMSARSGSLLYDADEVVASTC